MTRASVVQAAAAMADANGLTAVTLSNLAATLGVKTPSLYNHIEGQAALRRELSLLGIRELERRLGKAAVGKSGDDAVWAIANAYRDYVREHPGVYEATVRAPSPGDAELVGAAREVVDIVVAVLASYGLAKEDAIHAARALRSMVHGFASLEAAGGFGILLDIDASFRFTVQAFVDGLSSHKTAAR